MCKALTRTLAVGRLHYIARRSRMPARIPTDRRPCHAAWPATELGNSRFDSPRPLASLSEESPAGYEPFLCDNPPAVRCVHRAGASLPHNQRGVLWPQRP